MDRSPAPPHRPRPSLARLRGRRPSPKRLGAFLYLWLMVGFASGTLVLLAPARWVTDLARGRGWQQGTEDVVMMAVIAVYVIASFLVAVTLTRLLFQHRARAFKYGLVLGVTALAGTALWGWGQPAIYASLAGGDSGDAVATGSGAVFLFGPYPSREKLEELRAEGVTAVVSLQHPGVIVERDGIEKERQWTSELGLRFVHAPMLPWVSDNAAALAVIRELATRESGRFYLHCGLGRDRVNVVRHMLERMGATTLGAEVEQAMGWEGRAAAGLGRMERGEPRRIEADVWLVPRPNEHEMFGNVLAGQAGRVVLLLDPEDPEQGPALEAAVRLFEEFGVEHARHPVPAGDTAAARAAAAAVRQGPRPVTVVAPTTAPEEAPVADLFLHAWEAGARAPR